MSIPSSTCPVLGLGGDGGPPYAEIMTTTGVRGRPLLDVRSDLAAQLHPTLNVGVELGLVTAGSSKSVWWFGECGHEWPDTPNHRVAGRGCSVCIGKRVVAAINDLSSGRPDLAAEWHPTRNGEMLPTTVSRSSGRRAWWIDSLGHEWDAAINNRVFGSNCPFCAGTKVLAGFNDLATKKPELAAQWHPTKNDVTPDSVSPQSGRKVWWLCPEGHEWDAIIANRFHGNGCPVCKLPRGGEFAAAKRARPAAGTPVKHRPVDPNRLPQGVRSGLNDMATTRPDLAVEFHPTKNAPLTPATVSAGTGRRLWWLCAQSHEWDQTGNARTSVGLGCPTCAAAAAVALGTKRAGSGRRLFVGINDLASRRPDLAAEWHPTKNGEKGASDVTASTGVKVWWLGACGHEWEAVVASRTSGVGCPICSGQRTLAGFNDLATLQPEVAASWHPSRNGTLTPTDVGQYSNKILWWQCVEGHEWKSTVNNRSHGQGCPFCSEAGGVNPGRPGYVYFLENASLRAFKIGITNVDGNRLATFQATGWSVLNLELFQDGVHATILEAVIKRWWRKGLGLPTWLGPEDLKRTGGWTETISNEEISALECIERIRLEAAVLRRDQSNARLSYAPRLTAITAAEVNLNDSPPLDPSA